MKRLFTRIGWLAQGGAYAVLAMLLGAVVATQQPVVGVFSRIYMGGTGTPHCEIRWGSANPNGLTNTSDCALYMQPSGAIWENLLRGSTVWVQLANAARIGDNFYVTQFGALCDGTTDDTAAIQATIDAAYTLAHLAGHVIFPAGQCRTSGVVVGPVTDPWGIDPIGNPLYEPNLVVAFTSGDNTHFQIVSGGTLDPAHVGKSFTFAIPVIQSTINFAGGALLQPGPGSFAHWFKYYNATVTGRVDATHGTMSIVGLTAGSLDVRQFPDVPHASGCVNLPSGVPDTGCVASYWCHEHAHLQAGCGTSGQSATIDSLSDLAALATYQGAHGGLGTLYPYETPIDTTARFISLEGSSEAATILQWTGNSANAAVRISRNKYFEMKGIAVNNASGSITSTIGMALGGLPGGGTQTLVSSFTKLGFSGFDQGVVVGFVDAASELTFTSLTLSNNNVGFVTAPGSFNTLDIFIHGLYCGNNLVCLKNNTGQVHVEAGSNSNNGVDFWGNGFDTMSIRNLRSESVGRFFYGSSPALTIQNVAIAQPSAYRMITGNVTATPDHTRTQTINVTSTTCPQNICPISFSAGDITGQDPRKVVILPGLGAAGADVVATINNVTSTTVGTVQVLGSVAVASTGPVTATIFETNTVDLTWPSGQIVVNDVGGAVVLPEAAVPGVWSNSPRIIVTSYLSATTGKGSFYTGNDGAGPPIAAGATTTNPRFYDNIAIRLTSGGTSTRISEVNMPGGMIAVNQCGNGGIDVSNTNPLSLTNFPVTLRTVGVAWVENPATIGVFTGGGNLYTATSQSQSASCGGANGIDFTLTGVNNFASFFAGPVRRLSDLTNQRVFANVLEPMQTFPKSSAGTQSGNFYYTNYPTDPVGPVQQLNRIKELSESGYSNGHNLRMLCTFGSTPGTPAAALAGGGAGNVDNGTHEYYVTFVGLNRTNVSSAGTVTVVDKAADGKVNVSSIATGPTGTTARKVWRTSAGTSGLANAKLLTTIANNVATTFSDNLADASLGAAAPTYAESVCLFQRSESYTFNSNGTGGTTSDANTSMARILVTSGDFTQGDVGKIIEFPLCCGDFSTIALGPANAWATITSIFDATHVDVRFAFGPNAAFPSGTTTGTATVGQNEPDALWIPALWGSNKNETFWQAAFDATGVTLRSSNTQSTGSVVVGIIR